MRIAYFGHDSHDAAIRRRVRALQAAGHRVTGFMMRRGEDRPQEWHNIDLGETQDKAYFQRLASIRRGIHLAMRHADTLREADIVIARNLDMLIVAGVVRNRAGVTAPLIYECLDIHHFLTRPGVSAVMRPIEGALLRETSLVVVSSPAFVRDYFARHHRGLYQAYLAENRLVREGLPPRPSFAPREAGPLRIGWFGVLRGTRSLDLLTDLARHHPDTVEIHLAGKIALPDFDRRIEGLDNLRYTGPYKAPEDLPILYGGVDLAWAADYYQTDFNSWRLLPNRLYEGGYFGVPAIAPEGTETARWLARHRAGFILHDPVGQSLHDLVAHLVDDPAMIDTARAHLHTLPESVFVEPPGQVDEILGSALSLRRERRGRAA